ncbi:Porin [Kingella potus]|uniref:Porin n=1 Tax=Kingella potus TaxID=265175 RepID=A0A377R303_9NEIS|nr:hypothetical protein [Kingella potus]UOP01018.1 hypothetical protein LVJ84_01090 [Kingella potus]STR00691.1 Porin [Kingella potus]
MNKLFLTLLLAAFPAAADVELYGNIRSGVEAARTVRSGGSENTASVRDFGSYVGIKGRIPLGGQTRAGVREVREGQGFGRGLPPYRAQIWREADAAGSGENITQNGEGRFSDGLKP